MCLVVTMVTVVVPPTDSSSFSTVDHVTTTRYMSVAMATTNTSATEIHKQLPSVDSKGGQWRRKGYLVRGGLNFSYTLIQGYKTEVSPSL